MLVPDELVVILVAGLAVFVGLLRWALSILQCDVKKRMELLDQYQRMITDNARLKAAMDVSSKECAKCKTHAKYYYKEMQRYKNLYAELEAKQKQTLDKPDKK